MKIGIVVVVYSEFPRLCIDGIIGNTNHDITWYIHYHGTDVQIEDNLEVFTLNNSAYLYSHKNNRGLARSWNDGIIQSYNENSDITLVINDDIYFHQDAFDLFIETLSQNPFFGLGFLYGAEPGQSTLDHLIRGQQFACFAFGPAAFEIVGAFDENFFPAYSEDIDYLIRARLAGISIVTDPRVLVDHERNKTSKLNPEIAQEVELGKLKNHEYLKRKWNINDAPISDQIIGKDDNFSYKSIKIDWASRRNPFGAEGDRRDLKPETHAASALIGAIRSESKISEHHAKIRRICEQMVRVSYLALLGRPATPRDVIFYADKFLKNEVDALQFVTIIKNSEEYRVLQLRS